MTPLCRSPVSIPIISSFPNAGTLLLPLLLSAHLGCRQQGFIGYWLGPFIAIVLTEHVIFRRASWGAYEVEEAWNRPRHANLARGYAAVFTFVSSIGLIVVCMSQDEWTGPVARAGTGDIAMIVSFVYSIVVYAAARWLEKRGWP